MVGRGIERVVEFDSKKLGCMLMEGELGRPPVGRGAIINIDSSAEGP